MKLREEIVKEPKGLVYDYFYYSLVYEKKDYDKITRKQMVEEIIKEYNKDYYLFQICTERELKFLKYLQNHDITNEELEKYEWEIKELNKKLILCGTEIFEEQIDNVKDALELYKTHNKNIDELVTFVIGMVRINVNMLSDVLKSCVKDIFKIPKEKIDFYMRHPLIHFYCGLYDQYLDSLGKDVEMIYYRNYEDLLDEVDDLRKEYGIAGTININLYDYYDEFYYGFPINKPTVKKMYDEIKKLDSKLIILKSIELARVLNDEELVYKEILNEKQIKLIHEALLDMPCAIMNGFTPRDYDKEKEKEQDLKERFTIIPQNNAKISKNAADLYYKLYFGLLDYINHKENISPSLKKIYKQEGLNVNDLFPIDDYLWEHKDSIIDEYIKINPNNFNEEELNIINDFKKSETGMFFVVGYEREYTLFLKDGKIFMVKGIRDDIDNILIPNNLPIIVNTTLLMFKGNIIYNSFFKQNQIAFGNNVKEMVLKEMNKAIKYYHM